MSKPMSVSWQARLSNFVVRHRVRRRLGDLGDAMQVRAVFDKTLSPPPGVRYTPGELGGVPGEWVEASDGRAAQFTLLYLHGGAFVGGSPRTHRPVTAAFALRGVRVFAPDYRLAPEHPFPAALDDVWHVWQALCDAEHAAGRHRMPAVAGDSAGGNLALGLMLRLRDDHRPLPTAAALFSPVTDLCNDSPSRRTCAGRDAMFQGGHEDRLTPIYLRGTSPAHPLASPVRAELRGLPPLLLHVGEDEILRDDSVRLAERARDAGVRVDLQVWPGVHHAWQLVWRMPEARRSLDAAFAFLRDAAPPDRAKR